ncbi:AIPR protein [Silicimonas algicola]|uniref:AIPR protein n=2 Tax=Silicimonas algicola TaxID=1826607 RepID=A0A316G599_9RHOB|nr:AIPR protein [Silicimonas algicola]
MNTRDNLRDYIPGADPFKPAKRNSVHKAIEATIHNEPDRFINRNGGLTITCSTIEIDDKQKVAILSEDSVINGAQTRGEILRYLESFEQETEIDYQEIPDNFHVRAEIIADPEHSSVVETAIARNSASPVKSISQAGGRGQLNELGEVVFKATGKLIKKSETDLDGTLDTFHILQATRLLMPFEVSQNDTPSELLRPYKQRALCLEDFTKWYERKGTDEGDRRRYQFTLDIAATALQEFEYWQAGSMFNGKSIRAETGGIKKRTFKRDKKGGKIVWVSPGMVFPILSAMRHFVVMKNGKWILEKPELFEEAELVDAAIEQWRAADTNLVLLGRSAAAYSALSFITRTAKRASDRMN